MILSFSKYPLFCSLFVFTIGFQSLAKNLSINQIQFMNAPESLTETALQEIVDNVQSFLEWDLRKITVYGYTDLGEFNRQHHLSFSVEAVFRRSDSSIHISPKIGSEDFRRVFSHELVHAVIFQKYKNAIPIWLEEGLANYVGKYRSPDYRWLNGKQWSDVTLMGHPASSVIDSKIYYFVSAGLIEMIASKCSLKDLLQLSVGAKLTTYLKTYCEISDLNSDFKKWVSLRAESPTTEKNGSGDVNAPWWKRKKEKQWWQKK